MKFSLNVETDALFYKTQKDFTFGSGYISNAYIDYGHKDDSHADDSYIVANIDPKYIDRLYDNPQIDPTSISTNNVLLEEELFGIEAARLKLT